MPVVTIKFSLPEEQQEFETAIHANRVKLMLGEFSQQLRSWRKYHHDFTDANDALDKIREEFYRCINEYNVELE